MVKEGDIVKLKITSHYYNQAPNKKGEVIEIDDGMRKWSVVKFSDGYYNLYPNDDLMLFNETKPILIEGEEYI